MTKNKYLFVRLYKQKGSMSFSTSHDGLFPQENDKKVLNILDRKTKIKDIKTGLESEVGSVFVEFTNSMLSYVDFLPVIASFGPAISAQVARTTMNKFLSENSIEVSQEEKFTTYKLLLGKQKSFNDVVETIKNAIDTGSDIPRMLLIGAVSSFENHMAMLARRLIEVYPSIIANKESSMSYKEIMEHDDMISVKSMILEKAIGDAFRGGIEDHARWFEKNLNIDSIKNSYNKWKYLVEIFERRNLFVHAGGVVNKQYMTAISRSKFETKNNIGDRLDANPKYFENALEVIVGFGTMLFQVAWRKAKSSEKEIADGLLTDFGYNLIVRGKYTLAIEILEFALSLRGDRAELLHRMLTVNLANAHLLAGNAEASDGVLKTLDWSAVSDDFSCCIASIRRDVDAVCAAMRRIGRTGSITAEDYENWPVFLHVRNHHSFISTFERIFRRTYLPAPNKRGSLADTLEILNQSKNMEGNKKRKAQEK